MWSLPAVAALICACFVACLPEFDPDLGASSARVAEARPCGAQGRACCEPPADACEPELLCDPDNQLCTRPPMLFCTSDDQCRPGELCCEAGYLSTCMRPSGGACPDLDLIVATPELDFDPVDTRFFDASVDADRCLVERGCVGGYGWRRLLGLSTIVSNAGTSDLLLGSPEDTSEPTITTCGGERRFASFLRYELLDSATTKAQQDIAASCSPNASSQFIAPFDCDFQGLWSLFTQTYPSSLAEGGRADDCSWLDITGLLPGEYTLRVQVNPELSLQEQNLDNNVPAELPIQLPAFDPAAPCPQPPNLLAGRFEERECGWVRAPFQSDGETTPCMPGEEMAYACTSDDVEFVCGDYRVCDGTNLCTFEESIRPLFSRSCLGNYQPNLFLLCPASGQYSLWLPGDAPDGFTCEPYVDPFNAILSNPPDAGTPVEP